MARVVTVFLVACFSFGTSQDLTTVMNFEKFFRMEEELLTLSDLIVKQELRNHEEDVHKFANITGMLENVKTIHKDIGRNVVGYISHPINQFHLTRRLYHEWREILQLILNSDTCVKALKVKLQNIEENVPNKDVFNTIASTISALQLYKSLTIEQIMSGDVTGVKPLQRLSLSDAFDIANSAYEMDDTYYAIKWFRYIVDEVKENRISDIDDQISSSAVFHLLSNAYFKAGLVKEAQTTLADLLRLDPKNVAAKRNLEYLQTSKSSADPSELKPRKPSKKSRRLYEELCKSEQKMVISKSSRLKCVYFPLRNPVPYMKTGVRAEVVNGRPQIIVLYDMLDKGTAMAISYMGYKKLMDSSTVRGYSQVKHNAAVYDTTYWKWIPNLQAKFSELKLSHFPRVFFSYRTFNIGTEGQMMDYEPEEQSPVVGNFISFLTDSTVGGELVFPMSKIKIPVTKGNVVFAETRAQMGICPVYYGSQWYGSQTLFERIPSGMCPLKKRVPKFY
ncbi:prolyl 4-hydroxylase subunit alpha-1-like [Ostrea edulis]|uniref:prolyl 4-hydroxylase subunit alpha-1-like n=1 Tax=Ostrea edulis TaxID=37623 RepID=UPI0024AF1BE9|nr:prolyl 4-hydroxylase subunit alpha-1-like [Ostrea edulis]